MTCGSPEVTATAQMLLAWPRSLAQFEFSLSSVGICF